MPVAEFEHSGGFFLVLRKEKNLSENKAAIKDSCPAENCGKNSNE